LSWQGAIVDEMIDPIARCDDLSGLNGRWVAVAAELDGLSLPPDVLAELTLDLQSGTFIFGCDQGIVAIDRKARPYSIDVVATRGPNRGRFVPAIFAQAGGMLRICYDLSGTVRPRHFNAPFGSRRFVVTYRRAIASSYAH
jgi:uncharacterized protein (TIGR03067 family)